MEQLWKLPECFAVQLGAVPLGYVGSLELEDFDASFPSPTQDTPSIRHPELLPLPGAASAQHLALWRCELSDVHVCSTAFELSKSIFHGLSFLGCAGWISILSRLERKYLRYWPQCRSIP